MLILPGVVEAILVILFPLVAHGRPHHVPASRRPSFGLVFGCLHAWDHQRECGCRFDIRCCLILDEI